MTEFFSTLWAVLGSIPVISSLVEQFVAWYVNSQIEKMKVENRDAIKKAVSAYDQRDLEKAIGNPHAGEPSGVPGTDIVDDLPGVSE